MSDFWETPIRIEKVESGPGQLWQRVNGKTLAELILVSSGGEVGSQVDAGVQRFVAARLVQVQVESQQRATRAATWLSLALVLLTAVIATDSAFRIHKEFASAAATDNELIAGEDAREMRVHAVLGKALAKMHSADAGWILGQIAKRRPQYENIVRRVAAGLDLDMNIASLPDAPTSSRP